MCIGTIAQVAANRGPEEALVPRMDPGRTYIAGEVVASRDFPKDSIFPCSVETIGSHSNSTTREHIIVVITSQQLLETCREGGTGLLTHGIAPFSHGNLVIVHCLPLTDLKRLVLKSRESVTVESVSVKSANQTYFMSTCDTFAATVNDRVQDLKAKSAKTVSVITKHVERAQASHQEAERILKLVESSPTLDGINRVMDLCRQTTELYSAVNDDRSQEVLALLQRFIATPAIYAIIDNSESPDQQPSSLRDGDGSAALTEEPSQRRSNQEQRDGGGGNKTNTTQQGKLRLSGSNDGDSNNSPDQQQLSSHSLLQGDSELDSGGGGDIVD